ncbi:uncharacterized protein LOC105420355 [Amborella trichopoda]|uniref:uncharacterized protein LOC105420355 n=1 Tax=Amborella trichopoda TaxID=13333 RepID=UPI0005D41A25|nr:uncharacterized protein LOC105420355 [Amborella trichopoda]|eukprot:XP_011622044.1 uncharacterized protein LOC105420355 [Amborella trichopoda]
MIFEVLNCIDEQKVWLGTSMLEGEAEDWWSSVKLSGEGLGVVTTWENFLEVFYEKYFPDSVKERKEVEFIELQGNMDVEKYAAKFAELSRYAPHIINSEARKASKFERGLLQDIRGRTITTNLKTFSLLVDLAPKMERDCDDFQARRDERLGVAQSGSFKKKARPLPRRELKGRNNQGGVRTLGIAPNDVRGNQLPVCPHCGL